MTNNAERIEADKIHAQFKKEIDTVKIDDEKDISIEEIYELVKLSKYDLARALYTAYNLGYARSEKDTPHT